MRMVEALFSSMKWVMPGQGNKVTLYQTIVTGDRSLQSC